MKNLSSHDRLPACFYLVIVFLPMGAFTLGILVNASLSLTGFLLIEACLGILAAYVLKNALKLVPNGKPLPEDWLKRRKVYYIHCEAFMLTPSTYGVIANLCEEGATDTTLWEFGYDPVLLEFKPGSRFVYLDNGAEYCGKWSLHGVKMILSAKGKAREEKEVQTGITKKDIRSAIKAIGESVHGKQ